ncbi:hypothetical protein M406DRAFT_256969 [Cryphonectria parasitica EP155]|uniref:Uncharacterized protein n=1 Tax=Cryphonectria parasitica (strain ATCC 38755 / EP155) TaxID=660469 RepID=A0A9P5CPF3_CRYP1|nr:uncharacterized protein M406DRAFT_256969 [Cryphonectria parasitica EP155]KAF3765362.1 hypothetical protein M406DRAFT_256969 [Cryphonectria parasitica EP155]
MCVAERTTPPYASINHSPSSQAAEDHAFSLFNSIHSALRQWGSSVHHNGLSFYLAQAPQGSVFYHGGHSTERPKTYEWLAFEFEHAASFATPNAKIDDDDDDDDDEKKPGPHFPIFDRYTRGYYQIYRASRPLNLLYIDGESAAKCTLGPMDSQDLLLLGWDDLKFDPHKSPFRERDRAQDMCSLAKEWAFTVGGKIDGFIRMEAGFEIIYCDFSPSGGLDLVSVQATPFSNETGIDDETDDWRKTRNSNQTTSEWLRACAARFQGHPEGRVDIDWSSMVSAFAYDMDLSNPDTRRPDLPRIINATRDDINNVRARLRDVVLERGGKSSSEKGVINWQSVTDKIVTRFGPRLWMMNSVNSTRDDLIASIGTLIDPFTSYVDHEPMADLHALDRCAQHYLDGEDERVFHKGSRTPEDEVIAAALATVSKKICGSLFSARRVLRSNETTSADFGSPLEEAQAIIRQLISTLNWSTWKECGPCANDEICSIPMFPVGTKEDYFHPKCKSPMQLLQSSEYWELDDWIR